MWDIIVCTISKIKYCGIIWICFGIWGYPLHPCPTKLYPRQKQTWKGLVFILKLKTDASTKNIFMNEQNSPKSTNISTLEWKWFNSNSLTECYSPLWESNTLLFPYQVEELLLYQKPPVEHIYEKYFFYSIHLHGVFNFIKTMRWTINVRVLNLKDSLTQAFR